MAVRREIPLPQPQELAGWIPSERFPSDHLAVRLLSQSSLHCVLNHTWLLITTKNRKAQWTQPFGYAGQAAQQSNHTDTFDVI